MSVLSIKSDEASELARILARETGQSLTAAVTDALRERLAVVRLRKSRRAVLNRIALVAKDRRVVDSRSADDIIGYDESGAPA